jgi:biofilm PGA synthesis N-glycosyltransferase PgaC
VPASDSRDRLPLVVVVTFQDEERFLPTFLESLAGQTRRPDHVYLVDDGSRDRSFEIALAHAASSEAVTVVHRPVRPREADRLAEAAEFKAFTDVVSELTPNWEIVAKMDADLELSPRTVEAIEAAFLEDPVLGIGGAILDEVDSSGTRASVLGASDHVRGATKFYRRQCWIEISPIPPILGWDTLDEIVARSRGWRTGSVVVSGGQPLHLRPVGTHGAILRSFRRWGECSYGYGAHPLQALYYGIKLGITRRPRVIGGTNYLAGWLGCYARRAPRVDAELRRTVRREQLAKARSRLHSTAWRRRLSKLARAGPGG